MTDGIKRIWREYICAKCHTAIGDTGMCSYNCDQDFQLVRERKPGTVIERVYELTLQEERTI